MLPLGATFIHPLPHPGHRPGPHGPAGGPGHGASTLSLSLRGHGHGTQPRHTLLIRTTVVYESFGAFKNGTEVFLNPDVMCPVLEPGE